MLRILRTGNGDVTFALIGRMDQESLAELKTVVASETDHCPVSLDLSELTLVDRESVLYLGRCEDRGVKLTKCPAYVREWIDRERGSTRRRKKRRGN